MISLFFFERLVSRWLVTINFGNQHPLDFGSFFSPWVNESVMGLIHKINRFQFCLFAFFFYLPLSLSFPLSGIHSSMGFWSCVLGPEGSFRSTWPIGKHCVRQVRGFNRKKTDESFERNALKKKKNKTWPNPSPFLTLFPSLQVVLNG